MYLLTASGSTLAASTASDPTSVLLNYGAVGAMLLIFIWFSYGAYKRERDRADYLFNLLQQTNDKISDKLADTMKETKDALSAANEYLHDLARSRR